MTVERKELNNDEFDNAMRAFLKEVGITHLNMIKLLFMHVTITKQVLHEFEEVREVFDDYRDCILENNPELEHYFVGFNHSIAMINKFDDFVETKFLKNK